MKESRKWKRAGEISQERSKSRKGRENQRKGKENRTKGNKKEIEEEKG